MRILVTGGAGYIGAHVVLAALENGYDVTIFDNLCTSNKLNINKNAKLIKGDLNSDKDLSCLFANNKFQGVIHLAGYKDSLESMIDPCKYAHNNITGSLNLLNKCIEYNINSFIFSSSAAVYGDPKYNPVNENHPLHPINYYGFSKLIFEKNLKWFSKSYGITYAALRYFNAAGYDVNQRVIGSEVNSRNLIPLIMETAIGLRPYLSVYGNNYPTRDGTGIRDYIHVTDLAQAHIKSLEYINYKKKNLTINLGSETGYSVFDIIESFKGLTGLNVKYKIERSRKGDVAELVASCNLAKDLIGWTQPKSGLDKIIKSTWEIYKNQKEFV